MLVQVGYTLEGKGRIKEKVLETTNTRAGDECKSCGEFLFADVYHHFVQSEALSFVDGDGPGYITSGGVGGVNTIHLMLTTCGEVE